MGNPHRSTRQARQGVPGMYVACTPRWPPRAADRRGGRIGCRSDRRDGGRAPGPEPPRWNMTELVPELAALARGLVLDGELVSFGDDGGPSFPAPLSQRMLMKRAPIPVML